MHLLGLVSDLLVLCCSVSVLTCSAMQTFVHPDVDVIIELLGSATSSSPGVCVNVLCALLLL